MSRFSQQVHMRWMDMDAFAHVRSPHPGALPLVLLRAFFALVRWPASLLSRGPGGGR